MASSQPSYVTEDYMLSKSKKDFSSKEVCIALVKLEFLLQSINNERVNAHSQTWSVPGIMSRFLGMLMILISR
jgi:hypothetical protein